MDAEELEQRMGDLIKQVGDMMCWHLGVEPFGDAMRDQTRPIVRDITRSFEQASGAYSLAALPMWYRNRPAGGSGQARAYPPPPPPPMPGQGPR